MTEKVEWPAWRFGPDDQSAVFASEDEVPGGWADHPSRVGEAPKKRGRPKKEEIGPDPEVESSDVTDL